MPTTIEDILAQLNDNASSLQAAQTTLNRIVSGLSDAVTLSGDSTVTGTLTFAASPVVPNGTASGDAVNKGQLDAVNNNVVHIGGTETISGVKTFNASPVVPNATSDNEAVNKGQLDTALTALSQGVVQVVSSLPASGIEGVIYLVAISGEATKYTAYAWGNNAFAEFGQATLDLSGYALKTNTLSNISLSGATFTLTKGDNTTSTFTLATATSSTNGLMSSTDKAKLDSLGSGGGSNVSFTQALTSGTKIGTLTIDSTVVDLYAPAGGSGSGGGSTIVVTAPELTGAAIVGVGATYNLSMSASSVLNNVSIASFTITTSLGNKTVNAASNSATASFEIPSSTANGATFSFSVTATDSLGNVSAASSKTITARAIIVNQPTLTTDATTPYMLTSDSLTLTGSAFSLSAETGNHSKTDWAIFSSDDTSTTPVWSSLNDTSHKTSITIAANTLDGGLRWAAVRYYDSTYSMWSEWSATKAINIGVETPSGRTVYRHESNKGCVIVYEHFDTFREVFWADAVYRSSAKFGTNGTDSGNPNISYNTYIFGSSVDAKTPLSTFTDAQLQAKFPNMANDLPMRSLCDTWMTYEGTTDSQSISGVPAVKHCRNTLTDVFTGGCDLPDIYTQCVAFIEGKYIDALDPTAIANPTKAMSEDINTKGHGYMNGAGGCWSSTEYGSDGCLRLYYSGNVDYSGKYNVYGVCPARLLSPTYTKTPSERTIYRHKSNKGCVIEFDHFGTTKRVFWADAVYRTKAQFGAYGKDSANPNISGYSGNNGVKYISSTGNQLGAKDTIGTVTDATLQSHLANMSGISSDLPMRTLCDTWMTYEGTTDSQSISGVPAVRHCRNSLTDVFTGGCDLPDIYTLCVAFIEGKYIDALDPTAIANPTKAMSEDINPSGHGYMDGAVRCWSSSESDSNFAKALGYTGTVGNSYKNSTYGVFPAREL